MRNVPMFDKPEEQPVELSQKLSAYEYRLDKDEKAKWTAIKLKTCGTSATTRIRGSRGLRSST